MEEITGTQQNLWTIIITWGMVQCFVLMGLLLVKKRDNKIQRILLSLILLIVGVQSLHFLYTYFNWYTTFPHFIWTVEPLWFLTGPLLFMFERFSTQKNRTFQWLDLLHLLPFLLAVVYIWDFYLLPGDAKIAYYNSFYENYNIEPDYFYFLFMLSQLIYGIITLRNFHQYFKQVGFEYSNELIYRDRWVIFMLSGFVFYWAFTFLYHILLIANFDFFFPYDYLTYTFLTLFIQAFGFSAVTSDHSFFVTPISSTNARQVQKQDDDLEEEAQQILSFMEEKKPYLNPELRISDLSRLLDIPSHRLSAIINGSFHKNFFEFVNDYRVEEVKSKLPDPAYSHYTIDAIARECGFNSSASFYRVFKQSTGVTPSEYLKGVA